MSEEQNKKPCKCKLVILFLTIVSFFFSVAALTTSIYVLNKGTTAGDSAASEGKKVVISTEYDKGQSLAKAQETKKPIIVFFYTDWCGFCQKFAPTFGKITKDKKFKSNFAVAYVNCEKEENQKLMQEYDVQGFPTVFVIDEQGKKTQLDNNTFFNADSAEVVSKKALELIGKAE
ncbi:MAG: thioredoxin fold domain-containing protein [Candidatus Gastranaerophilales bacterium]|nr:thioredoxin fold domain-containing protein [Candidatus Gastranaerophilales bacterium]